MCFGAYVKASCDEASKCQAAIDRRKCQAMNGQAQTLSHPKTPSEHHVPSSRPAEPPMGDAFNSMGVYPAPI
eukprot:scaffold20317_cov17-Prasinocladus_malaysianus.AAC.1